jgi:acyl-CoA thioesterase-1
MSFMFLTGPRFSPPLAAPTYGWRRVVIQIVSAAVCSVALMTWTADLPARAETPVKIVALGDSLTAGYGLPDKDGFTSRLQAALAARGAAVEVENAGVSGDTASDGLARLDWSVPPGTEAVIVEFGGNDMLRGIKPEVTRDALDKILRRLTDRHIAVLLCGIRSAPNMGAEYGQAFESIYPDLARKYGALLYPFFLDGVAANRGLAQHDGMHPNAAGVDVIVQRILPNVEDLIARARALRPS